MYEKFRKMLNYLFKRKRKLPGENQQTKKQTKNYYIIQRKRGSKREKEREREKNENEDTINWIEFVSKIIEILFTLALNWRVPDELGVRNTKWTAVEGRGEGREKIDFSP